MSDTEAMVNLMDHAATLLDASQNAIATRMSKYVGDSDGPMWARALAAMATAQATLRMVSASVAPDGRQRVKALADRLISSEYDDWADKNVQPMMTAGELAAVTRFLRYALEGEPS